DPRLDPFDPENGYNPEGVSEYTEDFKETYFRAQSDRMNRLIDIALERMAQIEAGTYKYP
ncbi:MAG: alpha/beta hydrolase, partial [Gammaproteobacteria bacterium]|nr:alpha/beta hydrolase [Gammaproteobacteria bacterium]